MKNNKGFTLVELLAVVVILGILITLVVSKGLGLFNSSKNSIEELNKKAIIEGAKLLMTEIQNCDETDVDILDKDLYRNRNSDFSSCDEIKKSLESGIEFDLDGLINNNYVSGTEIEKSDNYNSKNVYLLGYVDSNNKINIDYTYNPYVNDKKSLAYQILYNAMNNKTLTSYRITPSSDSKELNLKEDDLGETYYYRGNVEDNYVTFNNMCWRIMRIEGDGSVKLVLEDYKTECNSETTNNYSIINTSSYGYSYSNKKYTANIKSGINTTLENWYNKNLTKSKNKLKRDTWCLENQSKKYDYTNYTTQEYVTKSITTSASSEYASYEMASNEYTFTTYEYVTYQNYNYDSVNRNLLNSNNKATLKCSNSYQAYIGILSADEVAIVGSNNSYLKTANPWWTSTVSKFYKNVDYAYVLTYRGLDSYAVNNSSMTIRPSITLSSGVENLASNSDGTKNKPYNIDKNVTY